MKKRKRSIRRDAHRVRRETFKDVETAPARFQFFEGLPSNDDVKNVSRMVYPTRECSRNYLQKARELSAKF